MGDKRVVEELRLSVPWGYVAAKAWGSPKGKRVLMVHGILDNAGSFDRLIPLLPDGFYFVCIDLPGHGLSSPFPEGMPLDFFNYVLSIRRVLDALRWTKCIYVAHSMGAQIGIYFSILYPERVEKVLSLDASSPLPVCNDELIERIRLEQDDSMKVENIQDLRLYTLEEVLHALTNLRHAALNTNAAEAILERAVTKVGDKYKYNRDPRLKIFVKPLLNPNQHLSLIKEIKVPIMFILAKARIHRISEERLFKIVNSLLSDRRHNFVFVEGNHDVHNNYPERVAPHICKFLGSIKSSL